MVQTGGKEIKQSSKFSCKQILRNYLVWYRISENNRTVI